MKRNEIYWLWLSLKKVNIRKKIKLLKSFGSIERFYEASEAEMRAILTLTPKEMNLLLDKDVSTAQAEFEMCLLCGIEILPFLHPDYPESVRMLPDAPVLFYTMGDWSLLKEEPKLTVVGTRESDKYGNETAFMYGRELAAAGLLIVSGMAEGIDGHAHAGALSTRGKTIAILGCGIDVEYPKGNLELKKDVAQKGLILSEFPLGTEPYRTNFPFRNRVLAALAEGVLVVQAGKRSGSLITAHCAIDQGKEVFAIPGNVDTILSIGTNRLIRDGEATMVLCPMDILSQVGCRKKAKPLVVPEIAMGQYREREEEWPEPIMPKEEKEKQNLSPEETKILSALDYEMDIDRLGRLTAIPGGQINSILTLMEMDGLVEKLPGNRYRRK